MLSCWSSVHQRLLEELYPQQGHIQLLPGEKNSSSQYCFPPISLLFLLSVKCTPQCYITLPPSPFVSQSLLAPAKCTSQNQLFLSVHPGSLMLEDLPYERFRRARNCSLPPPVSLSFHQPLLDWPPLSCKQPPLLQRHSRCGTNWLSLCRASSQISLHSHSQSSEQSRAQHVGKCFTCCFIQNIHKELRAGTQHAQATPPLLRIGWWFLWRQAGRHSNRLSDLLFIFCLARICGNADDVVTFNEASNWWVQAKKKGNLEGR